MQHKLGIGILSGRLFGGVGIIWKRFLADPIQFIDTNNLNGRAIYIKLQGFYAQDITITCVYFPCVRPRPKI